MKQTLSYNFKRITASLSTFVEWFPLSLQQALLRDCLISTFDVECSMFSPIRSIRFIR